MARPAAGGKGAAFDVVIVGAGHGGASAAIALRQRGFDGSIALVGEEPELPYERPPLSKQYLSGDRSWERMLIRPADFWAERGIALLTGCHVAAVDAAARVVTAADGQSDRLRRADLGDRWPPAPAQLLGT